MAQKLQVQPPEGFTFSNPSEWPRWRKRFERYIALAGVKDDAKQIDLLMYLMGDKADDIFLTLKFETEEEKKKLDKVLDGFQNFFIVRRNVIYERALFNSRHQEQGEPVDEFITALYKLAENCGYKDLHEEMIRDRIVVGVQDKKLSERLQLDNDLTLEKAVTTVRQHEAVKKQQHVLKQPSQASSQVDKLEGKNFDKQGQCGKRGNFQNRFQNRQREDKQCSKCGLHHVVGKACPAEKSECMICEKIGHWAKWCPKRNEAKKQADVREIINNSVEDAFMMTLTSSSSALEDIERKRRWMANVKLNGVEIQFKMDSGAEVTVVPYYFYKKYLNGPRLVEPDRTLRAADMKALDCIGMFQGKLTSGKTSSHEEKIYVVRRLNEPLLSLRACEMLGLVKRILTVREEAKSAVVAKEEFPKLFKGIGQIGSPYEIKVKDEAKPFAVHTPRRVPIPLMEKLQTKLEELQEMKIIRPVEEATAWCAPTVITGKPNGDIRLCVDLSKLNKSLEREIHPMPVVEHMLGQLGGGRFFSKLDANSGFHQILLKEESQLLTTFITPYGRYCFQRMPFGITTAPEYFQRTMSRILQGISGVICYLDDILIFAETMEGHDAILRQVLQKLKDAHVTLNEQKCVFGATQVNFLGHIVNAEGIRPDPTKITAVSDMPDLTNVNEVRRFLGLVNHLGRFLENLSEVAAPLNELLHRDQEFVWGPAQKIAFAKLKKMLTKHPVLAAYDVNMKTMVSADASSYGLGSVLKQETAEGIWRPIAYASRTMTSAEKRYAQIEKEALALTWASERFKDFLTGKHFQIETDHKPLVSIFTTKELDNLTPRLQRFRMRMMRFSFDIHHIPGKDLIAADALSRQPLADYAEFEDEALVSAHLKAILSCIPVTDERLAEIWKAQNEDTICQKLMEHCQNGWPDRKMLSPDCEEFWSVRDELASQNGLLMRGCRIVIPQSLRQDMLTRIHAGHLGISKCRQRARETLWWPAIAARIEEMIKKCTACIQEGVHRREPLLPSDFPTRPWQKVGMDLFNHERKWFLVVVDYYSRYPEIVQLERLTAEVVVRSCKSIFARHGVPETVMSDNGTQFGDPIWNVHPGASREFSKFAEEYGFHHQTSSPKFPQANGMAEIAVKIGKSLFKKNTDHHLALMEYRATPLENGFSPAELLMGRKIRTTLPIVPGQLDPKIVPAELLGEREEKRKNKMKENFDIHHGVREKEELQPGDIVWITDMRIWGTVRGKADTPRSYVVDTPRGTVRRNRFHLAKGYQVPLLEEAREIPDQDEGESTTDLAEDPGDGLPRTRFGRVIKPVMRYQA